MANPHQHAIAPTSDDILALIRLALQALPEPYGRIAADIEIAVEDLADDETVDHLELASPYELTGIYDGLPLTEKSTLDQAQSPDRIVLYRLPILDEWIERGNVGLGELVTNVVVHELAHHLGLSDADIAKIDRWWE